MTYTLMNQHGATLHDKALNGLYYFQLNLDALCEKLGVPYLSEYVDDYAFRQEMLASGDYDDLIEEIGGDPNDLLDPEAWHDPAALLALLEALEQHLRARPDDIYNVSIDDDDDDDDEAFDDDDDDGCNCDDSCGCCAGDEDYDAEDGDDIIELTPELILEDIAALKPVLQQAITDGDKVHLRMLS